jgi:mRNA-degrading endonuclease RelE of RelBE toxin-antitoxin system
MPDLDRSLKRFSPKERQEIERLVERIIARNLKGLDCKKLKGFKNLFRIRKGAIRVIFELRGVENPVVISIERRREDTYKF